LSALAQLEEAPAHKLQVLSMKSKAAYCYYMLAKIHNERRKFGYVLKEGGGGGILYIFYSAALHWLQLSSQSLKSLPAQTPQQKLLFAALCGYLLSPLLVFFFLGSFLLHLLIYLLDSLCADIYVGISQFMTAETLKEHQNDLAFSGNLTLSSPLLPSYSFFFFF
jgi:hypothetical protein